MLLLVKAFADLQFGFGKLLTEKLPKKRKELYIKRITQLTGGINNGICSESDRFYIWAFLFTFIGILFTYSTQL